VRGCRYLLHEEKRIVGHLEPQHLELRFHRANLAATPCPWVLIRSYTNAVKMVVASAINEEGEALYPRKWNHEFIDLPEDKNPNQPTLTGDVVTDVIALAKKKQHQMFFVLCASAGLRHGEALGIDVKNISQECSTIKVRQKAWRDQIHDFLKTESSKREIDLHPRVAAMLKDFIGERRAGLLFRSRTGKPLSQSNILRRWLHPILAMLNQPKCGAHAFRRFRLTHIRNHAVPKDLERFWMGHTDEDIGDIYSKLKEDVEFRQDWTRRIGLGFEIPPKKPQLDRMDRKSNLRPFQKWLHVLDSR